MNRVLCWVAMAAVFAGAFVACKARETSPREAVRTVEMTPEMQTERLKYLRGIVSELPINNKKWDLPFRNERLLNLFALGPYLFAETADTELFAVDVADGTPKWTFMIGSPLAFTPCLNSEDVFFVSNDRLFQVDQRGGNLVKKKLLPISPSSPPVANDLFVFLGSWHDSRVYCYEVDTFDRFQMYRAKGPILGAPVVVDTSLYFCSEDGNAYLYDVSGGLGRTHLTDSAIVCAPTRVGDRLYVASTDHAVYCLDRISFRSLWKYETGGIITTAPQATVDSVYVRSDGMALYALDAATGQERWRLEDGEKVLLVGDRHEYVLAAGGVMYQVSKETGKIEGRFKVDAFDLFTPSPDMTRVYLGTADGFIFALEEPK